MGDPTSRDVLVVGAGLAGARTVAELREAGFDGRIRVLGAEGVPPYDRPPLSKHLLDRTEPAWLSDEIGVDLSALADEVRLDLPASASEVEDYVRAGLAITTQHETRRLLRDDRSPPNCL